LLTVLLPLFATQMLAPSTAKTSGKRLLAETYGDVAMAKCAQAKHDFPPQAFIRRSVHVSLFPEAVAADAPIPCVSSSGNRPFERMSFR